MIVPKNNGWRFTSDGWEHLGDEKGRIVTAVVLDLGKNELLAARLNLRTIAALQFAQDSVDGFYVHACAV
jgi:hypothetical protein